MKQSYTPTFLHLSFIFMKLIKIRALGCAEKVMPAGKTQKTFLAIFFCTCLYLLPQAQPCVDPVVNLGPDVTQCGGSVMLDAGNAGSDFSWSDGSTGQMLNVTVTGTYSVTVTNQPSCTASATVNITINPVPVADLGADIHHCDSSFRDILFVTIPETTYQWSTGDTTQQIAATAAGNYAVLVTNVYGCTAFDDVNIFSHPSPVVNLGPDQTSCGTPVPLSGGIHNSYLWSTGATTASILATTTGAYSLTVTNTFNCSTSGIVNVLFHPVPLLGGNKTDSICPFSTADLTGYYVTQGWTVNYGVPNPSAVPPGVYPITVTNQFNCPANATITIHTRQAPNLGADVSDAICPFTTADLTSYFNTAGWTVSYLHSDNLPVATPRSVADGSYIVMATNAGGCRDTATVTITLSPKPNLGNDLTDSICGGYGYDLTALLPNQGYSSYIWNVQQPDSVAPGHYTLIVSNASGCRDTVNVHIAQRRQPVVTLDMPSDICYNEPRFTLTGGSPAGGTYYINGIQDTAFDAAWLGLTNPHRLVYVYTNTSGCTDSAVMIITVRPQPFINTLLPPDLCLSSTPINLLDYFKISPGGSPGIHYFSGRGVSGNFFYPVLTPNSNPITITDVYIDIYGCIDTSDYDVTVLTPVNVKLISSEPSHAICEGESVTFTASGADTYLFYINGQPVNQQPSGDPAFTTSTLQDKDIITVVGYNACSSDTSAPFVYDVHPLPFVDAGTDTTIPFGTSIQLNGDARGDGLVMYEWRPSNHLNFPTLPNPTFNGPDSVLLYLYATDANGCVGFDSLYIHVFVPDSIELPNIITPDGDGKNDTWKIPSRIDLTGSNLIIFNRWGTKVYEVTGYSNEWGGTNQSGEALPDGTYYYVFRVPSQNNYIYRGAINVLNGLAK